MARLEPEDDLRITRLEHASRKVRENVTAIWVIVVILALAVAAGAIWF
jgi:hypothetical protein